jgi:hypothetical protein
MTKKLLHHSDSLDRAYLTANSTALAVIHIYLNRYGLLDDRIRAVHPAEKAGWFFLPGGSAFAIIYHRHQAAPFACLTGFANGRR